jgi:hypothetical protein
MAKKGSGNSIEDIRAAIIEAKGDALRAAELLGVTRTSFYNYMHKNPELAALRDAQKQAAKSNSPMAEDVLKSEDDPDDAPVLTPKQLEILEFVDKESGNEGLRACVSTFGTAVLLKLEQRGFIKLRYEDGGKWAILTENGDIARLWHVIYGSREWELQQGYKRNRTEDKNPQNPQSNFIQPIEDEVPALGTSLGNHVVALPPPNPVSTRQEVSCANCAECSHRDVLEYLIAEYPEVKSLYEHVAAIKAHEKEAAAVLQKLKGQ